MDHIELLIGISAGMWASWFLQVGVDRIMRRRDTKRLLAELEKRKLEIYHERFPGQ